MNERLGLRITAGWFGQVIAWFFIAAVVAMLLAAVLIPRMGGGTPYAILTGSMRPDLPIGTLVVMKPVDATDIGVGNVVTYQLKSGEPTVVTHRVVAVGFDSDGTRIFTTQGDANNSPDAKKVIPAQIKGKFWYQVPYLGRVNILINKAQHHAITVLIVSGLLIYAGFMFTGSVRERIAKKRSNDLTPKDSTPTLEKEAAI